jgi:hypothetical protein
MAWPGAYKVAALEADLASIEQQLDETREEHSGEEGLLAEANEANDGEPPKITGAPGIAS